MKNKFDTNMFGFVIGAVGILATTIYMYFTN